ncbi:MAG: tetratricopeptide repeat protein [Acidobacteriota bacterium]
MTTPVRIYILGLMLASATLASAQDVLPADYAERLAELERYRQADPTDMDTLDALAGSYSMAGRYQQAIAIVQEMLAQKHDDPALLLRLAKLLAWTGQTEQSLGILGAAPLSHDTDALAFRCDVLSGMKRSAQAAVCFDTLAKTASGDRGRLQPALLGRARNQMWSGNRNAAAHSYEEYLRMNPTDISTALKYIELLQAQGNYGRAEKLCDQILERDPHNAPVLARRAEILFWEGNRRWEGRRNAEQAMSLAPDLATARVAHVATLEALGMNHAASEEVRNLPGSRSGNDMASYLEGRLNETNRIHSELPVSIYNDSDGIHDTMYQTAVAIPIRGDHSLGLTASKFYSSAPTGGVFTAGRDRTSVREFALSGTALVAPGMHVSLAGGGSTRSGDGTLRPTYNAVLSGSPWDRWTVSLGSAREFLKVTPRAIDRGIASTGGFAELGYWFNSRTSASVKLDRRWWSDQNTSYQGDAVFTRNLIYHRGFHLDGGALTSHEAFARNTLAVSGFFTPDHYSRFDGFLNTHGEVKKWLAWDLRGEGGTQQILSSSAYSPNWAVTTRLSVKLGSSLRLYGSYERKNYTLLAQNGWYQGFYISLGIQP